MKKKTAIIIGAAAICIMATGITGYAIKDRLYGSETKAETTEYKPEEISKPETPQAEKNPVDDDMIYIVGTGYFENKAEDIQAEEKTEDEGTIVAVNNKAEDIPENVSSTTSVSNTQTPAASSGNSGSNTQTPSGNSTPVVSNSQTPAAPSGNNGSESGGSSTAGNQESNAGKTWHPPVYENVWVVDKAAWTEEIPKYETRCRDVCNQCGADVTNDPVTHITTPGTTCGGYHLEYYDVQVGTTTVNWPEEGHWEQKLVREGYWE